MTEAILFPDAVSLVVEFLLDELDLIGDDTSVSAQVPADRQSLDQFVRVQRTGGPRSTLVTDGATITLEAWAQTDEAAHDLAQRVRAILHTITGRVVDGVAMYGVVEFAGPGFLPDPVSDEARYTQTFQVSTRGHAMSPTGS